MANYTMNRLVQGDVGCGKSIVSIISALMAVNSGYQAAIMVPTEILANQQYKLASELLNDFNCNVALLTSSTKKSDKEDILYKLNNNKISILIGTHSLLEDKVIFNKLGL